jgi:hypothetical protein
MNLQDSAILLYCIAAAAALIYLPFMVVGYARVSVGYDMGAPRAMFDKLPPYAQRATWAHQNSFETFMIFAAAALMAYVTGSEFVFSNRLCDRVRNCPITLLGLLYFQYPLRAIAHVRHQLCLQRYPLRPEHPECE